MKNTTLNNPAITVRDERILHLNKIVEEVKQSEEWEAVKMNILEVGIEQGKEQSRKSIIHNMLKSGLTSEKIAELTQIPLNIVLEVEKEA